MELFGFPIILLGLFLSWLVGAAMGGWQFGNLLRTVELQVEGTQLQAFLERLYRRLGELGFMPTSEPGEFLQGSGSAVGDAGAFLLAKTPKVLRLGVDASASPARVEISLRYSEMIVADTGEA